MRLTTKPHMRKHIITKVIHDEKIRKENIRDGHIQWQDFHTPFNIIDQMIDMTDVQNKNILVLFNLEFIEQLIYKYRVPSENIKFIADVLFEQEMAELIYDVQTVVCTKEENWQKKLIEGVTIMGIKHFDIVFSNPPYNRGVDLKIMQSIKDITNEMVVVHPSTWLIDLKGKSKLFNDTKDMFGDKIKSVTLFNGNPVFGIGLFAPCSITHIDNNKDPEEQIDVEYFGRAFKVSDINDVTNFGPEWNTIVKPFFNKMKRVVKGMSSVWDHNVKEIDEYGFYCQLAAIRGHVYINGSPDTIVQDDFYTMVMKDSEKNKGIRQPNLNKPGVPTPTFMFETEIERDNFINYLKTYFVRFCLSTLKIGQNIGNGEMTLIPWLDFTQEWNDEKLFEYFDINKETQEYIYKFLPDYYEVK